MAPPPRTALLPEKVEWVTFTVPPRFAMAPPGIPLVLVPSSNVSAKASATVRFARTSSASWLTTNTRTLSSPLRTIREFLPPSMVSPEASVMVGSFEANTMVARSPRENRIASRLVALPALHPSTAELVLAALMASLKEQSPLVFDLSSLVFTVMVVLGTAALAGSALSVISTTIVAARAAASKQSAANMLLVRYSDAVMMRCSSPLYFGAAEEWLATPACYSSKSIEAEERAVHTLSNVYLPLLMVTSVWRTS